MRCLACDSALNIAHAKRADDRDSSIVERWSVTCPGCGKVLKVTVSDPDTSPWGEDGAPMLDGEPMYRMARS